MTAQNRPELSKEAKAMFSEFWDWLWLGTDTSQTIGSKRAELREKYGAATDDELSAYLKLLKTETS